MKRTLYLLLFLLLALPVFAQQEAYDKYSYREDVLVALIKDFPMDSITFIDALMFQALDDGGWAWMIEEFGLDQALDLMQYLPEGKGQRKAILPRNNEDITQPSTLFGDHIDPVSTCFIVLNVDQKSFLVLYISDTRKISQYLDKQILTR